MGCDHACPEYAFVSAYKTYTNKQKKRALDLHKKGWGYARIAKVIGCYPSTVKDWVDDSPQKPHPGPAHSEKKKKAVIDYYRENKVSIRKAAKEHGISPKTLSRWLDGERIVPRTHGKFSRKEIIEDIKSGMSKVDVARKHGCSESWVYQVWSGK